MKRLRDVEMSAYTSFKAGGKASNLIIADTKDELIRVMNNEIDPASPGKLSSGYVLLGNGSNTIFACEEMNRPVIKLGDDFDFIDIAKGGTVKVGAATLISRLAKTVANEGLTGLEFAAGIPGSVGGAVFMNAGAYDGEIKNVLKEVTVLAKDVSFAKGFEKDSRDSDQWKISVLEKDELDLGYRHSRLMGMDAVVLDATFNLEKGDLDAIAAKMTEYSRRRTEKQPLEYPSAGSFFKRPEGMFAGKLIEDAGLKGYSVGGAQVSEKHAGFIVNRGDATYHDILDLMTAVQEKVKAKFDVELEPEVRIIRE